MNNYFRFLSTPILSKSPLCFSGKPFSLLPLAALKFDKYLEWKMSWVSDSVLYTPSHQNIDVVWTQIFFFFPASWSHLSMSLVFFQSKVQVFIFLSRISKYIQVQAAAVCQFNLAIKSGCFSNFPVLLNNLLVFLPRLSYSSSC